MAHDDPTTRPLFDVVGAQEILDFDAPDVVEVNEQSTWSFSSDKVLEDDHFDDLESVATEILETRFAGSEMAWLRHVWSALSGRGLTTFTTGVDRVRVVCRMAALIAFYREFSSHASEEGSTGEWRAIVHKFYGHYPLLSPVIVGMLAERDGITFDADSDGEVDGISIEHSVLCELILQQHQVVMRALLDEWGESPILAAALLAWEPDIVYPITGEQWHRSVNDEVTIGASMAYEWIMQGAPLD